MTSNESKKPESPEESSKNSSLKNSTTINRHLLSLVGVLHSLSYAQLREIEEIARVELANGEVASLLVRNSPGDTSSCPTSTLRISFVNGRTVTLQFSFFDEYRKNLITSQRMAPPAAP